MGQMDFISSILVRFFKIIWEAFHCSHVTDVYADQSPLFVHSTLIPKQWRHSDQRVCSCAVWLCCLSKSISGQAVYFLTRLQCACAAWSVFSAVATFL